MGKHIVRGYECERCGAPILQVKDDHKKVVFYDDEYNKYDMNLCIPCSQVFDDYLRKTSFKWYDENCMY